LFISVLTYYVRIFAILLILMVLSYPCVFVPSNNQSDELIVTKVGMDVNTINHLYLRNFQFSSTNKNRLNSENAC